MKIYDATLKALALAESRGGKEGLNCIAQLDPTAPEQARALDERCKAEKASLLGIPILIKDNIDVKGLHTTAGSLALADNIAASDAHIVRNLRKNGVVILGKTNMTEFANYTTTGMPGGYSSRAGQVIHAIDPALSPSGSSSGSGVAVSAGIVSAAVGTDTSFSIIACAQANGICGIKPPIGALPSDGIIPIARTLDSAGPMAGNFADALKLYAAMRDEPLPDLQAAPVNSLKIAVNMANLNRVSDGQQAFLQQTISDLKAGGAQISELQQMPSPYQSVIMQWEFMPHLEDYLRTSAASRKTLREITAYYEQHPETMMKYGITLLKQALEETPGGLQGAAYLEALENRRETIKSVREAIANLDAVIMTGPTNIMHFCGLPSVTVAGCRKNEHGVPFCLILYGADEHRLYRAALAIEHMINPISDR